MELDERTRQHVYEELEPLVGDEVARIVSGGLVGAEVVTKADLAATKADIDEAFADVDRRFEQVDRRFEQVDRRFEQVDRRFEQVDHRFELMEGAIRELRHELLAAFRGELAGQNRTMVLGMLGTAITVVLAAIALAQLL